jgi:hypothetical protein
MRENRNANINSQTILTDSKLKNALIAKSDKTKAITIK